MFFFCFVIKMKSRLWTKTPVWRLRPAAPIRPGAIAKGI